MYCPLHVVLQSCKPSNVSGVVLKINKLKQSDFLLLSISIWVKYSLEYDCLQLLKKLRFNTAENTKKLLSTFSFQPIPILIVRPETNDD